MDEVKKIYLKKSEAFLLMESLVMLSMHKDYIADQALISSLIKKIAVKFVFIGEREDCDA